MHPACRWIEIDGNAYLHWNYACCATLRRVGDQFERASSGGRTTMLRPRQGLASGVRVVEHKVDTDDGPLRLGRALRR